MYNGDQAWNPLLFIFITALLMQMPYDSSAQYTPFGFIKGKAVKPPVKVRETAVNAAVGACCWNYTISVATTGSGNLIVVGIASGNTSELISGLTDNASSGGNSYTEASFVHDTNGGSAEIWYVANSKSGATTLTITGPNSSGFNFSAWVAEFSGVKTISPVDGSPAVTNNGAATTVVSAPKVTTTTARSVVISMATVANSITGIHSGSPFIPDILNGDDLAYYISSATGSYGAVWNQNTSGSYAATTVAFKSAQ